MENTSRLIYELNRAINDNCLLNLDEMDARIIFSTGRRIYYGYSLANTSEEIEYALDKAVKASKASINNLNNSDIWIHIISSEGFITVGKVNDYYIKNYGNDPIISAVVDEKLGNQIELFILVSER